MNRRHELEGIVAWTFLIAGLVVALFVLLFKGISHEGVFWSVAAGFTGFYGVGCFLVWPGTDSARSTWPFTWLVHHYWFSALGCFVGWAVLHHLMNQHAEGASFGTSASDYLLASIAFLGLVGYLPWTVAGIAGALGELARRVLQAATKST